MSKIKLKNLKNSGKKAKKEYRYRTQKLRFDLKSTFISVNQRFMKMIIHRTQYAIYPKNWASYVARSSATTS